MTAIKNENHLYWTLQFVGWGTFFLIFSGFGLIWYQLDWKTVVNYLNISVFGFIISHFYHIYIKQNRWQKLPIGKLALRIFTASLILSILWQATILPVTFILFKESANFSVAFVTMLTVNLFIVFLIWNLIYFFYKLFRFYKESEVEKWRLNTAAKDAQLIALKSQINPHFIFNSLNNIRSLVIENPEKARDMITHLSGLLRYSIQFSNIEKVTIKDEIDIVRNYLNLESIQFEDRLRFTIEIEEETLNKKIPPMSVQILVENAIKHGISKLPEGGIVNISCKIIENEMVVEVTNTGYFLEADPHKPNSGIGIKNTTERLKLLFGKFSKLTLRNHEEGFVSAKFTIPLNKITDYESIGN
ncbi:MAG: histidine kinase [Cyclobacteriaceae bacterium]|nr:histidine kinase [Cyclobacteriaceae bacterium]